MLVLVLLSIILVGQNVQAAAADKRALDTYKTLLAHSTMLSELFDKRGGADTGQEHDTGPAR